VSTFDQVSHRLEEELRLAGFAVVSAAVSPGSSSPPPEEHAAAAEGAEEEGAAASPSSSSSSPVRPPGCSGRAATLTVLREGHRALLDRAPGLCPLLPSVVCVFEAGGRGGDIVVSAAAPAALPVLLLEEEKRGRKGGEEEASAADADADADKALAALRSADAAIRAALESVFRLPKMASPPGTYSWPLVKGLPPVGGSAAVAGGKARSQAKREEEMKN
jgi:hypothetical protein